MEGAHDRLASSPSLVSIDALPFTTGVAVQAFDQPVGDARSLIGRQGERFLGKSCGVGHVCIPTSAVPGGQGKVNHESRTPKGRSPARQAVPVVAPCEAQMSRKHSFVILIAEQVVLRAFAPVSDAPRWLRLGV